MYRIMMTFIVNTGTSSPVSGLVVGLVVVCVLLVVLAVGSGVIIAVLVRKRLHSACKSW